MKIIEFRIPMPLTLEEYRIGHLHVIGEFSKAETGGGEGVEVISNEPGEANFGQLPFPRLNHLPKEPTPVQYTDKWLTLRSKLPRFIQILAHKHACDVNELAWNAFPYCKTKFSNPSYMKDGFSIFIDTVVRQDGGEQENVFGYTPEQLVEREVNVIDIANDPARKEANDPKTFKSTQTGRGPLGTQWRQDTSGPMVCVYKVVRIEFKWFGLQDKVEMMLKKAIRVLLLEVHRELFCSLDQWYGMTIEDIRAYEQKTKDELNVLRHRGEVASPITGQLGAV